MSLPNILSTPRSTSLRVQPVQSCHFLWCRFPSYLFPRACLILLLRAVPSARSLLPCHRIPPTTASASTATTNQGRPCAACCNYYNHLHPLQRYQEASLQVALASEGTSFATCCCLYRPKPQSENFAKKSIFRPKLTSI